MSHLDEKIVELCPDGVKYLEIGAVIERSSKMRWSDVQGEEFQYIDLTSVDRVTHAIVDTDTITSENAPSRAQQHVRVGDVLFGTTRPMLKRYAMIPTEFDGQVASTGYCVLRPKADLILTNFLFHLLGTDAFYAYVEANERGSAYPAIPDGVVKKFRIPVPPLEVQHEIVKVLDSYTELEVGLGAELEAELDARKLQYEYYRDALLAFPESAGVQRIPMGEVSTIARGASPRPIQSFLTGAESGVPWIKIGDVGAGDKFITRTGQYVTPEGAQKSRRVHPGDFVMSNSMSFGRPYISKIEGCIHDGWLSISDFAESFLPDFLYHLLRSRMVQAEFSRRAGAGTVQNLNASIVRSVIVPVPPLDEQMRVVEILDSFEELVKNLAEELPAEFLSRRQQYEHYRDRLLTFQEAVA